MYFLLILLFLPMINNLVIVKIHRDALYVPSSPCAFIRNASFSNDPSIQSCIWECVHELDCQTAVYYTNENNCSLFTEHNSIGQIQSSPNIQASVICYQKNHNPVTTCSTSPTTTIITSSPMTIALSTTTAVPIFLINPGGELGSLFPWTSNQSSVPLLDKNGTNSNRNILPYNGSYAFYGSTGGGSLHQKVSLTNTFSIQQLDSGLLYASVSFWERTYNEAKVDAAEVALIFLSDTNNTISSVTTGPQNCTLAWCHVTGNWFLPHGTRTIDYVMTFIPAPTATTADSWIDDNILNVS